MEENNIQQTFMSAEVNEIFAALSSFQGSIEQPKLEKEVKVKTRTGGEYKFKYADLSACVRAVAPTLKENGLAIAQIIMGGKLITLLTHKSGQWIKSELLLPQQTGDYQAFGSAITYLKRYSYCAILGIVADTDDDANMAHGNGVEMKDRRSGKAEMSGSSNSSFTKEQLNYALAELSDLTSRDSINDLWIKWQNECPAMCQNGTKFYNAVAERLKKIGKAS